MTIGTPTAIATTQVFGYVFDEAVAVEGAKVTFRSKPFMLDDNLITIDETVFTDSAGLYEVTIPQTILTGTLVNILITYNNGEDVEKNESIIVGTTSPVSVQESRATADLPVVVTGGPQGPTGATGIQGPQGLPGSAENVFFKTESIDGATIDLTSDGPGIFFIDPDAGNVTVKIPDTTGTEFKWKVYKNTTLSNKVFVTTVGGTDLIGGKTTQTIALVNTGLEVLDTGTEYDIINSTLSDLPHIDVSTSADGPTYLATEQAVYLVDADTGDMTFRLPDASDYPTQLFYIRTNGSNNNKVTVDAVGGDLIDGVTTQILPDNQSIQIHTDAGSDEYNIVSDTRDSATSIADQSTGVKTGGILSAGAGADEYSISDGTAQFVTSLGVKTEIIFSGLTNRVPSLLLTNLISFIGINSSGTVIEQAAPFTRLQTRTIAVFGVVVHVDMINVDTVNNEQQVSYNTASQLYDLANAMGFFNVTGGVFSANGANLSMDKTLGSMFKAGSNYFNDLNDPHVISLPAVTSLSFQYRFSDGSNGVTGTVIDPDNLDDGAGGLTAIATDKWSVHRIYNFTSNNIKLQRGVEEFSSLNAAIDGITTEAYVTEPSIAANGLLRGWLVVKQGATVLNGADALFLEASKFPNNLSPGSAATSDMQSVYDNSVSPEVLTNTTNGPLTLKRGSAADTDNIYEGQNGAGATTFAVDGNGNIITSGTVDGIDIAALDSDVTKNADTTMAGNGYFLDEDNMVSDDATKVASQQSIVAYIAATVAGVKSYKGGYNAATNTPDLDTSPSASISSGDVYDVTAAGTFFTIDVEVGDMVTARQDAPTLESHWVITQANLTPASIKTQYESNADTNAFTDSQVTDVSNNVTHAASTTNPHSTDVGNLGSGTLAEFNIIITDATLDDAGDSRPPDAHSIASHSDTTATGTELNTLTSGGNADSLHSHAPSGTTTVFSDYIPGTTSDPTTTATTSGTAVTISEMTKTFTPADATNEIEVFFSGTFGESALNKDTVVHIGVFVDGTLQAETQKSQTVKNDTDTDKLAEVSTFWQGALSAASHTVDVRFWGNGNAGLTMVAIDIRRAFLIKEIDE